MKKALNSACSAFVKHWREFMKKYFIILFIFILFIVINNSPQVMTDNVDFKVLTDGQNTYFLEDNGDLWFFGANKFGMDEEAQKNKPIKIAADVSKLSLTAVDIIHILKKDGTLWGIGNNKYAQVGNGEREYCSEFVKILEDVKDVKEYYALKNDGSIWFWGPGLERYYYNPEKTMDDVIDFFVNNATVFALKSDKTLWISGRDDYGFLEVDPDGGTQYIDVPIKVTDNVKEVKANGSIALILKEDKTLWGIGKNEQRILSDSKEDIINPPVKLLDDIIDFNAVGRRAIYAVKSDNSLWVWGNNEYGLLGDGMESEGTNIPQKLMENVKSVHSFWLTTVFVIKQDNSLWGWGEDYRYNIAHETSEDTVDKKSSRYITKPTLIMKNVNHFSYDADWYDNLFEKATGIRIVTNDGRIWAKNNLYGYSFKEHGVEYDNPDERFVEIFFGDDFEEKMRKLNGKLSLY